MAPVDRQPRAGYLDPSADFGEASELGWQYLGQEHYKVLLAISLEQFLHLLEHTGAPLPSQRAQYDSKQLCTFRLLDLLLSNLPHLLSLVHFVRQLLLKGIVLEKLQVRIPDHAGLYVEAAIPNENDRAMLTRSTHIIDSVLIFRWKYFFTDDWASAAEHLS